MSALPDDIAKDIRVLVAVLDEIGPRCSVDELVNETGWKPDEVRHIAERAADEGLARTVIKPCGTSYELIWRPHSHDHQPVGGDRYV